MHAIISDNHGIPYIAIIFPPSILSFMAFKVSQKFFNWSEDSENIKNTVICPIVIIQDENSKLYKFHPGMKVPEEIENIPSSL